LNWCSLFADFDKYEIDSVCLFSALAMGRIYQLFDNPSHFAVEPEWYTYEVGLAKKEIKITKIK